MRQGGCIKRNTEEKSNLNLNKVGVVYDVEANEIIHCMRFRRGKRYCEQFTDLVKIRW
jgi:hypothetical protein